MKEMTNDKIIMFNVIGKKNNQTSVSYADRKIPTLGSTDNAGNLVNLISSIIHLPLGWDFSICIGGQCLILFISRISPLSLGMDGKDKSKPRWFLDPDAASRSG